MLPLRSTPLMGVCNYQLFRICNPEANKDGFLIHNNNQHILIDKKNGQKGLINIERLNKTGLQILDVLLSDCKSERAVQ
jgi:hypothetical protein